MAQPRPEIQSRPAGSNPGQSVAHHGEGDTVRSEEQILVSFKTDQQTLELVDPGKSAFFGKSLVVHFFIEQVLAP